MRTLTGLSGEYETFDQNALKMLGDFELLKVTVSWENWRFWRINSINLTIF